MTLTLLALFLIPLYLKMVLAPKHSYKLIKHLASNDTHQMSLAGALLLLALIILSSTGLNFAWEWESLLAWLGLSIGLKGIVLLIPGNLERKLKIFKPERLPILGFIGLIFALALVYIDTQVLIG